jgi:thioester reductase-like protein
MYMVVLISIYWDKPLALGIGDRPLSTDMVVECLAHADVDAAMLPPAILEEMSQLDETIAPLKTLKYVAFAGGNLPRESGNRLVQKGVTLSNAISATEFTPFPIYWQENQDLWQYFIVNSDLFGCDWRKVPGQEDVYEQVIVRKAQDPGYQGFFFTFPNDNEYSTKDLYRPHPTEPDNWIYHGRADNIIVFSTGEKLNPVTIEEIITGHPEVDAALVVGSSRFQPALILEPTKQPKNDQEATAFIDRVWPLVVKANKETVAHGQIGRSYIIVSNPKKPFPRAGKGTVQRAAAVKLYEEEIDALYASVDSDPGNNVAEVPKLDVSSKESLTKSISSLFTNSLHAPPLDPETDFFSAGVDSMQVISASRLLRAGLEAAGIHVDAAAVATRVIYGNPTPAKLASYVYSVVQAGGQTVKQEDGEHEVHAMEALLEKYTRDLPQIDPNAKSKPDPREDGQVVLITGTTGGLGCYLLDMCLHNPRVAKVICLNRSEDGLARQTQQSASRGLSTDFAKAEFLHADLSRSDLGLGKATYDGLLTQVDRVIHNQWPVNFNMPVESFEPHIRGVRYLADFSIHAARRVPVVFMSTIGTIDVWDPSTHPSEPTVPERAIRDFANVNTGYGRSKLVSSLVLDKAAEVSGVPVANIRIGQIAGPRGQDGFWNRQEWLPTIVASSLYLGALPNDLGGMSAVEWVPIEDMARLVLDVTGVTTARPIQSIKGYFHGVNPRETTWDKLAPAVKKFYGERITKLVSLKEWVALLEKSHAETEDVNNNPGLKLLDTYKGMVAGDQAGAGHVRFSTERTETYSHAIRDLEAVTPELMINWCKQWHF